MMFKCHCRDCQQVTGGGFVAGLLVPASAFRLTKGQLRYHFAPSAAGGKHKRGFCAECGSRITGGQSDERPTGFVGVTAGILDDPSGFRPQMGFFRFRRTSVATTFELSGPETAWPAMPMMSYTASRGPCRGGPLDGRVRRANLQRPFSRSGPVTEIPFKVS